MIPLALYCIFGGCLTAPIDTRPLHRQIIQDQFNGTPDYHDDSECDELELLRSPRDRIGSC